MRVREKQVDYREAENDDGKIKDAQLRRARSAPTGIACKPQIENVSRENEQRDRVFGIVVPNIAREPVNPDEAHRGADGDGDESDQDTALAHAIEKVEGWEAPDHVADAMFVQEALFSEVDEAKHTRKAKMTPVAGGAAKRSGGESCAKRKNAKTNGSTNAPTDRWR